MAIINDKNIEIHVKGGFSERKGFKHFSDIVQIDNLNERTRNRFYVITENIFNVMNERKEECSIYFVEYIYVELFSLTKKHIPKHHGEYWYSKVLETLYEIFLNSDYSEVLTLIEGIIKSYEYVDKITGHNMNLVEMYEKSIEMVLKNENVNYRIINGKFMDIDNEKQIQSIEETIKNPYKVVSEHYCKAIDLLYESKDYDNSIKESISSVEAMCQILTNNNKITLGQALKLLKSDIHPALESAFEKIYGYTSDSNGIRHSNGLGEGKSTFEEAKYMLISCSAFISYLKDTVNIK